MTQCSKYLGDVIIIFSAAFQELNSIFFSKCFSFSLRDLPLWIRDVGLVANNDFGNVLRLALIYLFEPVLETVKGFPIINSIDKDNSSGTFVIGLSNGLEPFLASSIPDLHFDFDAVDRDSFDFEIDSDGGNVSHLVFFIHVSEQYVGFAYSSVSDDHHLDQIIVFVLLFPFRHSDLWLPCLLVCYDV